MCCDMTVQKSDTLSKAIWLHNDMFFWRLKKNEICFKSKKRNRTINEFTVFCRFAISLIKTALLCKIETTISMCKYGPIRDDFKILQMIKMHQSLLIISNNVLSIYFKIIRQVNVTVNKWLELIKDIETSFSNWWKWQVLN